MMSSSLCCGHSTIPQMRNDQYNEHESESTTLSSGICDETRPTCHIHNIPLIDGKIFIIFQIFIHSFWKRFLIGYLFGVIVYILEGSKCTIIIECSRLSVLCTYLLYPEMISLVHSSYFSECEVMFSRLSFS